MRLARLGALPISLLAVGATLREDALVFRPEPGSSVEKSFEVRFEVESESIEVRINDAEVNFEIGPYRLAVTDRVVVEDLWIAVADGRPTELRREFVRLSRECNEEIQGLFSGGGDQDHEMRSELEDEVVVFRWDQEEERYDVRFEEEGDEDLLEGLREDLDLRGFLPPANLDPGETWEVPVEAWAALVRPGGDLLFEGDGQPPVDPGLLGALHATWEGELEAASKGTQDLDGVELEVVVVTGEVSAKAQVEAEGDDGMAARSLEVTLELELELLWDPRRGHLHSLEGSGELECRYSVDESPSSGPRIALDVELVGEVTLSATFER